MNWLSNLFGGAGRAIGGAARSIGGAVQSAGGALGNLANAGARAGQSLGSNLMGAFKPATQSVAPKSGISFGGGITPFSQQPSISNSLMSGFGSLQPQGSRLLRKSNFNTPSLPGVTSQAPAPTGGGNDWWSQMINGINIPQLALGTGINAAGNLLAPKVKTPDITSSPNYQALKNFNYQAPPGVEDMIRRNHEEFANQERRNLDNIYKNVRPGTDYTTDSAYIRDRAALDASLEERFNDELTKASMNYSGQEQNRLSQLADADIQQIMLETGMNAQEAEQFKQSFSNIGSMLTQNALPQQNGGNLMELFKLLSGGE